VHNLKIIKNSYLIQPSNLTDLDNLMREKTDYDELEYYWTEWREQSGKKMRDDYRTYIDLMNSAALANGFDDAGLLWQARFEDKNFVENIDALWTKVEPLYDALHTYVRHHMLKLYGDKLDANDKLLPAHLFGNMWSQNWASLYETTKPFADGSLVSDDI
jgi:peptidyl-dipeptidase A